MSGLGLAYNDRVQESTTTSGTGTISLGGAVSGYQAFSAAFSSPTDVYYAMKDSSGNWEVGIGTYTTGSPGTVSRNTVLQSSNSNALVSFTGSGQTIWVDMPAKAIADRGMSLAMAGHLLSQ